VEGPFAEELVEYLLSIRPANPGNAPIHFNPETGRPFVDIRKQWVRLMTIASRMLGYDLEGKKRMFFNFRDTGASHIAQRGKTPAHLLAAVQMMGDTSVATVKLSRDVARVPLVRLSGHWLEAYGFKEGARFVAVGVEGGLLVLTVYEPAPEDRASTCDASRSRVRRAGAPSRRKPS
jgi:hypothetical protein